MPVKLDHALADRFRVHARVVTQLMRSGHDRSDTIGGGDSRHLERLVPVGRAVVHLRQQMAMNIDEWWIRQELRSRQSRTTALAYRPLTTDNRQLSATQAASAREVLVGDGESPWVAACRAAIVCDAESGGR